MLNWLFKLFQPVKNRVNTILKFSLLLNLINNQSPCIFKTVKVYLVFIKWRLRKHCFNYEQTLAISFLSGKSITATKYIFDCLVHFLQYRNSIRISLGLQIELKLYKLCNTIRADSRQHIMSLRLNLLCPPLWAIFRVYALYSNRNANYFYPLTKAVTSWS